MHLRISSTQYYLFTYCTRVADSDVHKIIYAMYIRPILYKQVPFMSTISCLSFISSKIILLYFICTSLSFLSKQTFCRKSFRNKYSKQPGNTVLKSILSHTACLGLVHGDDPQRCYGEGGGRGVHVWERM